MVNPSKIFVCTRCEKAYPQQQDAIDCCPTEIYEQYECTSCGTLFDTEKEAMDCCGEEEVE